MRLKTRALKKGRLRVDIRLACISNLKSDFETENSRQQSRSASVPPEAQYARRCQTRGRARGGGGSEAQTKQCPRKISEMLRLQPQRSRLFFARKEHAPEYHTPSGRSRHRRMFSGVCRMPRKRAGRTILTASAQRRSAQRRENKDVFGNGRMCVTETRARRVRTYGVSRLVRARLRRTQTRLEYSNKT